MDHAGSDWTSSPSQARAFAYAVCVASSRFITMPRTVHGAVDAEHHGRGILHVNDLRALFHVHPSTAVPIEIGAGRIDALGEIVDIVTEAGRRAPRDLAVVAEQHAWIRKRCIADRFVKLTGVDRQCGKRSYPY
jgi:hypothetical protein